MERSLIKEISKKNMGARLSSSKVKPTYFPNFFGIKAVASLKWETLTGEKGAPVMADIISYDATAPIKSREIVGKMSGDIPKTAVKRGMNESDENEYKQLAKDANVEQSALLDLGFKDTDFVYNAVRARFEWLTMRAMSLGEISLDATNNNGIVTESVVGFGIPETNKFGVKKPWDDINADGLADIEDFMLTIEGLAPKYLIMHSKNFIRLKKQKSTIDKTRSYVNNQKTFTVTLDLINEYMTNNDLPKIITVNPQVRYEDKDHKRTLVNPWEESRMCFIPDLMIGDIQHGPIAAESSESIKKIAVCVKKDFIFVQKWGTLDPYGEWTKAEANAFPVLNDPDTIYLMRTDKTTWA